MTAPIASPSCSPPERAEPAHGIVRSVPQIPPPSRPAGFPPLWSRRFDAHFVEPVPTDLPSRGRDVDGTYRILLGGEPAIGHIEFQRRNQAREELEIDVAEAQVRLVRREKVGVISLVWDLYGKRREPVHEERVRLLGQARPGSTDRSQCVYQRINLRGMGYRALLAECPPALWPLVALTADGAAEEPVRAACEAIEALPGLGRSEKADYLAVLWFIAEAEQVPVRAMRVYLSEEKLMESVLYQEIFAKGEARGRAEGEARGRAEGEAKGVLAVLEARGLPVSEAIRARILGCTDVATLDGWLQRAKVLASAAAVVRSAAPPAVMSPRRARKR
ncbi:MAG: hypothetical protein U0359_19230 [Byssovorax sp.]